MRRSRDLAIFVPKTTTDIQTDYFTPAAHARGVTRQNYEEEVIILQCMCVSTLYICMVCVCVDVCVCVHTCAYYNSKFA